MSWNAQYGILLAASTLITYLSGILIGKQSVRANAEKAKRLKKMWAALSFVLNIGILIVFKYLDFFSELFTNLLACTGVKSGAVKFDLLLPVGISFYTFQALSYTVDVYRGNIKPVKHFGKYALFVSFFPQLVAGPIEKSKNLLHQFDEPHSFDYDRMRRGLLLMLWGYFEKMIVADRLGQLVNTVYQNPASYSGLPLLTATIFFAFQIYCDFGGYSHIAIGAAEVLGFRLTKNFDRPYYSLSIQDFWRRWHITLGAWFRDYLYIPLGGNRCSQFRHCLNILIVFAVCGLWHGAAVNFVVWGVLHGLYQIIGVLLKPAKQKARTRLKLNPAFVPFRLLQAVSTFVLVDFAWIFFRAKTFEDAIVVITGLFQFSPTAFSDGSLFSLGLPLPEFMVGILGILTVLLIDSFSSRRNLRECLLRSRLPIRWTVYVTAVMALLIFGIYGSKYGAQQFIYFQF